MSVYTKYFLGWLPMIPIAIANGVLREILLLDPLGDGLAHQVSTITLFILLGIYIWYMVKKNSINTIRDSWLAGMMWFILTVFFEFGFGYLTGQSVPELLNAYNILEGRLWIIIPLWVGVAPRNSYASLKLKNRSPKKMKY